MTELVIRRRRHRFILLWMMGTALWIALMLIAEAEIRPAPSFDLMAPLVFGVPAAGLVIGLLALRWWARKN